MTDPDKRERDRRYERTGRNPKASWYKLPEWCHPISGRRALQLKAEPFCRFHAKRGERVVATVADHIEPHRYDPVKFWQGALQSLCKRCHDSVKQSMERNPRHVIGPDGWPIDPNVKRPKGGGRSIPTPLSAGTARLHFFSHLQFRKFRKNPFKSWRTHANPLNLPRSPAQPL